MTVADPQIGTREYALGNPAIYRQAGRKQTDVLTRRTLRARSSRDGLSDQVLKIFDESVSGATTIDLAKTHDGAFVGKAHAAK